MVGDGKEGVRCWEGIFKERLEWECVGTHKGEHRGQCDRCMSHNGINRFKLSQFGCTHKQGIFGIKMSPDVN